MQRERENPNTTGSSFDGFGFHGSMFPSLFGGKDPFDDPFFSRPSGSMFRSNMFSSRSHGNLQQINRPKGPVIKEIDSDDELVPEENEGVDINDAAWRNRNPLVQHPEDQKNDHGNSVNDRREISLNDKAEPTQPHTRSMSFQRVTYGGINGAYYTATTSRRMGSDGVALEESKQADRTTGQATHRISRGIQDKGHSVTRNLDSDGKVDTVQTLHNLNEDELAGFEEVWRGNAHRHSSGWNRTFSYPGDSGAGSTWGGFLDPFEDHSNRIGGLKFNDNHPGQHSRCKLKKVVTINIE